MGEHCDYSDYERLIREARLERSAAVGEAIGNLVHATVSGIKRGFSALRSGRGSPKKGADANHSLDVPVHH